ncbi:MAG TPA: hypothetical protein VEC36_04685, partial [Patescibacteria group bacterium]|nr:hypothetical protein [Patescibacteria group bacterium]
MKTEETSTEYSEKLVPLTHMEIHELKRARTKNILGIGLFSIVWYSVLYFIAGGIPEGFLAVFLGIFAVAPIIIVGITLWNARKDLEYGKKKVIRGRLDSKLEETRTSGSGNNRSSSTYYFFTLSGTEIEVQAKHYKEFQTGDIIEIEKLPKSGDILKMRELRSNLLKAGEKKKVVFANNRDDSFKSPTLHDSTQVSMEEQAFLKSLRNKRALLTILICGAVGYVAYNFLILV